MLRIISDILDEIVLLMNIRLVSMTSCLCYGSVIFLILANE